MSNPVIVTRDLFSEVMVPNYAHTGVSSVLI